MTISIIIPVYNSQEYIIDCLTSITNQTYCDGKIECILVDDCGTDNSIEICHKFIACYNGPISFCIEHHTHNKGASSARNTGIKIATGDYILFIDSDDWITETCVEELVSMTKKYPNANLVIAGIKTTDGSIPWFDFEKNNYPEYIDNYYDIKTYYLGREILPATPYNKLIPRTFILDNHLFFEEGIVIEDVLWCNLLAKYIKSIAVVNKSSYFYRIHEGSVVTSGMGIDPKRKLLVYNHIIETIDEPFVMEQVNHMNDQLYKLYFNSEDISLRRECAKSYRALAKYSHFPDKIRLLLKSFFASKDNGNSSFAYYLFYLLDSDKSYFSILLTIIRKVIGI